MRRTKDQTTEGSIVHRVEGGRTSETKFVWVYGSFSPIIHRAMLAMINNEHPNYDFYRIKLGIGIDELFIPVWWNVRNRAQTIKNLMDKNVAHVLIMGREEDKENSEIQELFKQGEAVFIMPEEIKYHENSAGETAPAAWHEVKKSREQWHAFLDNHFEERWTELL